MQRGAVWVFPRRATRCTDRVKFGVEEGTKGIGPPKLKFLLKFDQNVEYKCPAGAYSLTIFIKLAEFVPRFRTR